VSNSPVKEISLARPVSLLNRGKELSVEIEPDFERFRKVVMHQEADRVPLCEALVGYGIMSRFLGREVTPEHVASQVEFWTRAGYDYVPIPVSILEPGKVTEESKITRILREMVREKNPEETNPDAWNLELSSFIHEREDFERFPWDAASEIEFGKLEALEELLPEKMKVVVITGKIFTLTWMLMGFQNFSLKLVLEPDLVGDVFRKIAAIQSSALDRILSKDYVGAVWAADDMAFGSGPMISPEALREHVFPWYREMAECCHAKDRIFVMHSDGDLTKLMPDLIDIGVDLLQPVDPTCMDIAKTKKEFGDRICLAGNVPNEMLRSGTVEEVEEYVKNLLRNCGPGGGYCVGSGNSVPDWSKFENFMAMRDTALKYGTYPIRL
jgi:uroporphyrinogen decarboxylase